MHIREYYNKVMLFYCKKVLWKVFWHQIMNVPILEMYPINLHTSMYSKHNSRKLKRIIRHFTAIRKAVWPYEQADVELNFKVCTTYTYTYVVQIL